MQKTTPRLAAYGIFLLRILNPTFWLCGVNDVSGASTLCVLTLYLVAHASDNLVCLIYQIDKTSAVRLHKLLIKLCQQMIPTRWDVMIVNGIK